MAGIASLLALGAVVGCGTQSAQQSGGSSSNVTTNSTSSNGSSKPITIGWSVYGVQAEFAVLLNNAVHAEAKKLGVKLITMDANYDANTENNQLNDLIAEKVNAILLDPISATGEIPEVQKALSAGIPVIGVNTTENTPETCYVGSNDFDAGTMEMSAMAKALNGQGNIVVLEGPIGQSATNGRNAGIKSVLQKYPGIHVLSQQTANWQRNQALSLMQNWLSSYGTKIDGVVAENDDMAAGVISALQSAGLVGKIPVVGVDGIIAGLQNVQKGYELESVFQDAYTQGTKAVDEAVAAAEGKQVPKTITIPFIPVTKDNAAHYLQIRYQEEHIK